jgi:hypothetical protein
MRGSALSLAGKPEHVLRLQDSCNLHAYETALGAITTAVTGHA